MNLSIEMRDYTYDLPSGRIALHPLSERDQSKLLVFRQGIINHSRFDQIAEILPANSLLFFNNTRVIPARIIFQKETGAEIEVFLLQPVKPSSMVQMAMQATQCSQWKCSVGNLKRWNAGLTLILHREGLTLVARLADRENGIVEFSWTPEQLPFAEVVDKLGATPLPPYLNRAADADDRERYQTVYSLSDGAVAAPTAGLHFTEALLDRLRTRGILTDFLTLHVSAGTFQPVKVADAVHHDMHSEQVSVTRQNISNLILQDRKVIAVGTTSLRTLESVYWFGVKLLNNRGTEFRIHKFDPYHDSGILPSRQEAITAVAEWMDSQGLTILHGETSIYILPGYRFRVTDGLVTNFHQPGSTLLLLVAALIGQDWKQVYDAALANDYRFLSYGDSSLLLP